MSVARRIAAGLLLLAIVPSLPSEAEDALHESLQPLEAWLGEWGLDDGAWVDYRAVLGGRFVEARRRDPGSGELLAHSMIAAGDGDGVLTEYRFGAGGSAAVRQLDVSAGPPGTRAAHPRADVATVDLDRSLAKLAPFLGRWEVTVDWLDGGVLWAQMTNRAELGGHVICSRVLAAQDGQAAYDRYRTFYYQDDAGDLREIAFTYTGKVVNQRLFVFPVDRGVSLLTNYEPGSMTTVAVRKRLVIASERRMHWTDDFRSEDGNDWERAIDAEWVRVAPADPSARTMPVDDRLFAAAGADNRSISVEQAVHATPEAVWKAWTTEAGWKAAYAPDRPETRANIELAPAGRYEWLFDGVLGCNGCQVLSYLPPRMLSFTWNAPVTQTRSRLWHTWVVVEVEPGGDGETLVRLTQLGFGEGAHWDETRDYFEKAWAYVLEQMASNLGE